ncbi:MAG: hypothetical protein WAZ18_04745 [Alphaproteobacteria bacterium]
MHGTFTTAHTSSRVTPQQLEAIRQTLIAQFVQDTDIELRLAALQSGQATLPEVLGFPVESSKMALTSSL